MGQPQFVSRFNPLPRFRPPPFGSLFVRGRIALEAGDLNDLRHLARLSIEDAAHLAGVTVRTFQRWEREHRAPRAVFTLFYVLTGHLPDPAWEGWRFAKGQLWTPGGQGYQPGEVQALPYLYALLHASESRELVQETTEAQQLTNVIPFPGRRRS